MKRTLIVISSNRPTDRECQDSLTAIRKLGSRLVRQSGSADVAFARCAALTMACKAIRAVEGEPEPIDTVLMLDDDMVYSTTHAQLLVDAARARGVACSAAYVTINDILAAHPWKKAEDGKQLWLVGLGMVAIPAALLLALEDASPVFAYRKTRNSPLEDYREFCESGVRGGRWQSEDYSLSERLGGVHLLPIQAGHRKTLTLWPRAETLEELTNADR